ncbi:U32 family peptidase [Devosia sp. XJ19-1]|uniref:Ubiquinone biosynthesis protein UbiV n=1 Tax=Devosia ureilytica TaxID=2952754 RepID=A0A9Q4ASF3_9HYPH|nr:U32 family peptidase [Devosia ureilytica]MCP8885070.1 U32 family peptidase [Devosia ureilytica]MCP8889010.1 U32 family peptidase [Devosia ureilytica]
MPTPSSLKITMGPVPYLWSGEKWRDFYYRIAESGHVDAVTLGEVVCSKRDHFTRPFLPQVIERLTTAGKSVAVASLALVTLEREVAQTRRLAEKAELAEANDLSALRVLSGKPHLVGPFVNVYNGATARLLAKRGAIRICLGPELPAPSIASIISGAPRIEYEIIAFGRLPLAISARCAHARAKGNTKDNCQFVCGDEPDGLDVDTLDGQPFLTVNGVQTMSRHCQVLLGDLPTLVELGVTHLRLSPQDCDMAAVAEIFAEVRDGRVGPEEGIAKLKIVYSAAPYSNGFLHGAPGMNWVAA